MTSKKKKKINVNPDQLAERDVKSAGQDILCIFIFYDELFRFYHVSCLNILKFGHRFYFWNRKIFWCTLTGVLFSSGILTIFDRPFYVYSVRSRTGQRAHDSKCFNEVYKAFYII